SRTSLQLNKYNSNVVSWNIGNAIGRIGCIFHNKLIGLEASN
ncbi:21598_t:CDS:1, partial [Gigaspora margarita]